MKIPSGAAGKAGSRSRGASKRMRMQDYVPYQLAIVSSRLSRALETVFGAEHGLSRPEWRALALASEAESCLASDLVAWSGMDAVAVHRAVKRLEEMGLVERTAGTEDRRARPLRVTEQGRRVYSAVVPHALALERQLLEALGDEEGEVLRQALRKLMQVSFPPDWPSRAARAGNRRRPIFTISCFPADSAAT